MAQKNQGNQGNASIGFGVDVKRGEKGYGKTMTYGKMKLLSVIVQQIPSAKADLGIGANQRLNWEYGGWSPEMVAKAHEVIDRYVDQLPPRNFGGDRSYVPQNQRRTFR